MSNFPESAVIFNTAEEWEARAAVAEFAKWLAATLQLPGATTPKLAVISNASITPVAAQTLVGGSTDNTVVETINTAGMHDGAFLFLAAASADFALALQGGGNIQITGQHALSVDSWVVLQREGAVWKLVNNQPLENHKTAATAHKPLFDEVMVAVATQETELLSLADQVNTNAGAAITALDALDVRIGGNTSAIAAHTLSITGLEDATTIHAGKLVSLEALGVSHEARIAAIESAGSLTVIEERLDVLEASIGDISAALTAIIGEAI